MPPGTNRRVASMSKTAIAIPQELASETRQVLLIGNPNVGKSALFGALTGRYVTVSNYPGTTVEISQAKASIGRLTAGIIDTPGANSLLPTSDDERATRDILLDSEGATVVVVADAKSLTRSLMLVLQLAESEIPFTLALNMMDEVHTTGVKIDTERLSIRLGVDVVPTVAVRHEGVENLAERIRVARRATIRTTYPDAIETTIARTVALLPHATVSPRSLALMALCGDAALLERLRPQMTQESVTKLATIRAELHEQLGEPLTFMVNRARQAQAKQLADEVTLDSPTLVTPSRFALWLEWATTHRFLGIPILAAVLWICYQFVGVLGAGTLVDLMETRLFGEWINPVAIGLFDRFVSFAFVRDMFVGEYGVLTMALTYSLALVLPIVGTFFIAFGALEDSGYLPRLAVMVNRALRMIGLNGKAILPMVLGLGCDTMATLTTRILETPKERMIVIILLALGVPCSAQLTVILVMLGALSPVAMAIWIGVILSSIAFVGRLAHMILPGKTSDFVLELPPLRIPRIGNILIKTMARIEWYLKEAVPLFVIGTLILFFADRLHLLAAAERLAEPVLGGLLGLPKETAAAFIIGFLRRDFGVAGLYHMTEVGTLDAVQVLVSVVTITLFIPCIANFFMIVKERGWKTGLAVASFIFPFALFVGATLNLILRAVPVL